MLNELYEKIEAVLNTINVGGEQSRQFAGEIELLKEVLGQPGPIEDEWDEIQRRQVLTNKLKRLAVESEGILIPLPKNPINEWFDGTYQDAATDVHFEEVDLANLLTFIVDVGVDLET